MHFLQLAHGTPAKFFVIARFLVIQNSYHLLNNQQLIHFTMRKNFSNAQEDKVKVILKLRSSYLC